MGGGGAPSDSSAAGTIIITAGSDIQQGNIVISSKGTAQSLEQITAPSGTSTTVYSNGFANDSSPKPAKTLLSAELSASSQSALFPLPLLSGILASPDSAYQYFGIENVSGVDCQHIRVWKTFSSQPDFAYLAPYTIRDVWIDAATNLPLKMTYSLRDGSGAAPTTAVEISYSKFQAVNGIQYPFQIAKSVNGTPWASIIISTVSINTGIPDSAFSIQ